MPSILLVEDDQALLNMYKVKFQIEGFELVTAKDGVEGLDRALVTHPDVILLDILMPRMNGLEMLKKVREDKWGKNVPVIILTNLETTDQILQGIIEDQPSYYLLKANTTPELVVEKVKEVIGLKKKQLDPQDQDM